MTANECLYSLASIPCTSNNNPSPDSPTPTSSTTAATVFKASAATTRTTDAGSADDQCSQRRQLNAHRKQQNASRIQSSSDCQLPRRPCRQHWLPPSSGLLITALLLMLLAVPGVRLSDQRTSNATSAEANGTTTTTATTTATTTTASSTIESNDKIIATLLSTANMPAENLTTPTSSIPWFSSSSDDSRTNATQVPAPNGSTAALPNNASTVSRHFQLISFNWAHVQTPISLSLWLLLASIAKIFFNMDKRVAEAVPDSALLIVLGLALGSVLQVLDVDSKLFTLPSSTFFLYLLPPIIFDAGYFMPNRQLFENFDSVLLFAIVGTIWNTLAIGYSLFWLAQLGCFSIPFTAFQILLFASLISAVDPVAVIAVFEQIHINEFLFINVFGEALFNDGVSVVLYQMFRKFILIGEDNLLPLDYLAGIGSFFVIAVGGVFIGLLFAVIASLATKYTRSRVSILAPVFVFVVPYISYLAAEMFGLSSILAIVACGIAMKQYVKGNLSQDAANSVKYFIKMLAQCSETVIFMFLGLSAVSRSHDCDWVFVLTTIGFCLLFRIIGVVVQCFLLNRFRTKKFSFSDQFVLSYGGLRGAIAFGLVVSLDDNFPAKQMFVTSCIAVIFFTVFVQGITIRPLLHWLHVEKQDMDKEETMIEKIYTRYCDYMMAGLEDITGQKGRNAVRDTFERFNSKVLKPALMRGQKRTHFDTSSIVRAYRKIIVLEAHRLSRVSFRKKRGGPPATARVGPAHSPSSATSTLTMAHSNCWTTTTGGTGSLPNGSSSNSSGGIASANGGGKQKRSVRLSESSDEGQQQQHQRHLHLPLHLNHHNHHSHHKLQLHETPLSSPVAHSQQSSEDGRRTVSMQHDNHANNLGQQYRAQPESAELLYELARKLRELRQQKDGTSTAAAANEVVEEEDLMEELEKRSEEDDDIKDNYLEALQPKNSRGEEFLSPTAGRPKAKARPRKQQQQPKQRRRCSLSPSLP